MSYLEKNIVRISGLEKQSLRDAIAIEEPLQIFLRKADTPFRDALPFTITMRTPGRDDDLIIGHLYAESVIHRMEDVDKIQLRGPMAQSADVLLAKEVDLSKFTQTRHSIQHGGCGVCGKSSLDFLERDGAYLHRSGLPRLSQISLEYALGIMDSTQSDFQATGGVHAAALFDIKGQLVQLCEDVGRHNAMDKLVGWALSKNMLPLKDYWLLLSGRTSFELMQKAHEAGISIVASIGAPSSLAIEMAEENGITLIGFLKKSQMNIYNDQDRIEYVQNQMESN